MFTFLFQKEHLPGSRFRRFFQLQNLLLLLLLYFILRKLFFFL